MAAMTGPRRLRLEAPVAPAGAAAAVGHDDDVADVAGVAAGAVEQAAVEHDAAADAGRHDHGEEVPAGRRRPAQPSPRASALASLSTQVGRPVQLGEPVAAAGSPATQGCSAATPSPRRRSSDRRTRPRRPRRRRARRDQRDQAPRPPRGGRRRAGVGTRARPEQPSRRRRPAAAAILVPPMSTASARSSVCTAPGHAGHRRPQAWQGRRSDGGRYATPESTRRRRRLTRTAPSARQQRFGA